MSSEDNLCSPLLERLKRLQKSQQQCRLKSNDYLLNVKSPTTVGLHSTYDNKMNLESNGALLQDDQPHIKRNNTSLKMDMTSGVSFSEVPKLNNSSLLYTRGYGKENCHKVELSILSQCVHGDKTSENLEPNFLCLQECAHEMNDLSLKDEENEKSLRKFPYLRKGQGTARFRTKTFKGFRKISPSKNHFKSYLGFRKSMKRDALHSLDLNKEMSVEPISKNFSTFEKLEELAERDSFCSTSSKVMTLLQDESTCSSTPLSSKTSLIATLELTPISNEKRKFSKDEKCAEMFGDRAPFHNLPFGIQSTLERDTSLISRVQSVKPVQSEKNDNISEIDGVCSTLKSSQSGILKKSTPNMMSPSMLKVKFLEPGVKVLEYDEPKLGYSSTLCSDDSDLISSSDLENLALLNFNVNVVHESSILDENTLTNQIQRVMGISRNNGESLFRTNASEDENKEVGMKSQTNSFFSSQHTRVCTQDNLMSTSQDKFNRECEPVQSHFTSETRIPPHKPLNPVEKEDVEIKAHKVLLLSKVNDLRKEINIFKKKNRTVEELIAELQKEKQSVIENQKEKLSLEGKVACVKCIIKSKGKHDKVQAARSSSDVVVAMKLQDLNEKLRKLETENKNLQTKVRALEKRGKEMKKDENEAHTIKNNVEESSAAFKKGKLRREESLSNHNSTIGNRKICYIKSSSGISSKVIRKDEKDEKVSRSETSVHYENEHEKRLPEMSESVEETEAKTTPHLPDWGFKTSDVQNNQTSLSKGLISLESSGNKTLVETPNLFTFQLKPNRNITIKEGGSSVSGEKESSTKREMYLSLNPLDGSENENPQNIPGYKSPILILPEAHEDSTKVDVFSEKKNISASEDRTEASMVSPHYYLNGDEEMAFAEKVVYHYAKDNVTHTMFKDDGREEIEFANGQKEIYFKDGSYQLLFPDNSSKSVYKDGTEVCVWRDGTVIRMNRDGTKSIYFPNGQKEIYENGTIRRIYPDGTLKTLYADGRQETRYKNGTVRIKDKNGNVSMC